MRVLPLHPSGHFFRSLRVSFPRFISARCQFEFGTRATRQRVSTKNQFLKSRLFRAERLASGRRPLPSRRLSPPLSSPQILRQGCRSSRWQLVELHVPLRFSYPSNYARWLYCFRVFGHVPTLREQFSIIISFPWGTASNSSNGSKVL